MRKESTVYGNALMRNVECASATPKLSSRYRRRKWNSQGDPAGALIIFQIRPV